MNVYSGDILLKDGAEHGVCLGFGTSKIFYSDVGVRAACENVGFGRVKVTRASAHSGKYGYEIKLSEKDVGNDFERAVHKGKLSLNNKDLSNAQKRGARIRYSAYYYIKSGFDFYLPAWSIQMQWKGILKGAKGDERYWLNQNPKIALGFQRLDNSSPLEIIVTIREANKSDCKGFSYDRFTRKNTLNLEAIAIPENQWFKIIVEVFFSEEDGSVEVWQEKNGERDQVIKAEMINTVSQLINKKISKEQDKGCDDKGGEGFYYTNPTHFVFGMGNYISGKAFQNTYRAGKGSHNLYLDDILIESIE